VRVATGKPDYFIAAIADISELKKAQRSLLALNSELESSNRELNEALATIKSISDIVPLCAWCGNSIRNEQGEWIRVEEYFEEHTDAQISHVMCPKCRENFGKESNHGS